MHGGVAGVEHVDEGRGDVHRFLASVAMVGVVLCTVAATPVASGSAAGRWVAKDLGTLGGTRSSVSDINNRGQIVGSFEPAGVGDAMLSHAFLWQNGKMTDLGVLPGYEDCYVAEISERGQVVGSCYTADGETARAFLWDKGHLTALGTLGGKSSHATGINEHGQVVGSSGTGKGRTHAFLWQSGKMKDLGALPHGKNSTAVAINERGQVIGSGDSAGGAGHAFLWQSGKMTDLGVLPGGRQSKAVAIDDSGRVVAYSWFTKLDPNGEEHYDADFPKAFLWQGGHRVALGGLPGRPYTIPTAIGERGVIVGWSYDREGLYAIGSDSVPFRWANGKMQGLPGLTKGGNTEANAINGRGLIVGDSSANDLLTNAQRAVVWESGKVTNLGALRRSDPESWAVAINDHGWIVGMSGNRGDDFETPTHAVLWTRAGS